MPQSLSFGRRFFGLFGLESVRDPPMSTEADLMNPKGLRPARLKGDVSQLIGLLESRNQQINSSTRRDNLLRPVRLAQSMPDPPRQWDGVPSTAGAKLTAR